MASEEEKRLLTNLFHPDNHDITVRPVRNYSEPSNVKLTLTLYQLIEIVEKQQTIVLSAWLTTEWTDYQMKWNPEDYNGLKTFNIRPSEIWVPDIVLYNNVDEDTSQYGGNMDTLKTRVKVYHTGEMFWIAPLIIKGHCEIHVSDFPFDVQKCPLKFGSWTNDLKTMNLLSGGVDISSYSPNLEWNLKAKKAERHEEKYDCCPIKYADITFYLLFERRSLFYVLNLIFPIAMITILTILSFILPHESEHPPEEVGQIYTVIITKLSNSKYTFKNYVNNGKNVAYPSKYNGERIGLSITLMLAVTVFMLLVAETTPDSSEGLPIVSVYFIFCMILMFFVIVFLCSISRMYTRRSSDKPMNAWIRKWIFDHISYVLHIRHHSKTKEPNMKRGCVLKVLPENCKSETEESKGGSTETKNPGMLLQKISNTSSVKSMASWIQRLDEKMDRQWSNDDQNKTEEEDEVLTCEEEWRVVAMTIDRILLISFTIIFIVGTIGCFAHTKYVV